MKHSSIFVKLTILYLIAITTISSFFIYFYAHEQKEFVREQHHRYFETVKALNFLQRNRADRFEVISLINELQYDLVEDPALIRNVLRTGEVYFERDLRHKGTKVVVMQYEGSRYLMLRTPFFATILKDAMPRPTTSVFWAVLGAIFFFTTLVFALLLKSLMPLRELKEKIGFFSEGRLDIDVSSAKNDEIAEVANEFDKAVKKIKALIESRQMFMRTIMHELRTPIAKGRVSAEMLEEGKQKERIIKSYERLDELIREFAKIEQLTSKTYTLKTRTYGARDVIEHAVDMLMLPEEEVASQVTVEGEDAVYSVDFDAFTLALKNLLDNGIKYGSDRRVHVRFDPGTIEVESRGEPLAKPLEHYCEPFAKESKDGLGLGLYLVKNIIDAHGMELHYRFEDGANIFAIII